MGTTIDEPAWKLPPAEPNILRNFTGYLQGLQILKELATILEEQMEDCINHKKIQESTQILAEKLEQLSDHVGELADRMENDNFYSTSPELNPPFDNAKQRTITYIQQHPGTIDAEIAWLLRCTENMTESVLTTLIQEGKIEKKGEEYFAR